MKKMICFALAAVLALGVLAGCSNTAKPEQTKGTDPVSTNAPAKELAGNVATDGSTSMQKVINALGESFVGMNPNVNFTYNPTGSSGGIKAVSSGTCDIGLSSRALKDEEVNEGLVGTVLAYDGIAMIVNPENPVEDLDLETIAKIYTGEITNWSEIGGNDAEIVLIGREAGSGTRSGFEEIVGVVDACQYRQELTSTGDVITAVASNPNAIGYASLASVKDTVKALKVAGVAPTEETVKDGTYVIQRPFVLVTKEGVELSETAQAFFDYALSPDANEVLIAAGVVPANRSDNRTGGCQTQPTFRHIWMNENEKTKKTVGNNCTWHFPDHGADYGWLRAADYGVSGHFRHSRHPQNWPVRFSLRQSLGFHRKGTEVWHSPFYSDQYLRHRRGNSSGCPHWLPDRGVSG